MHAADALKLEVGQTVTVPFGRSNRLDERRVGTVTKVEDKGTWGRGMRPASATPNTRLVLVSVDLGGRIGVRHFGNGIVEVAV